MTIFLAELKDGKHVAFDPADPSLKGEGSTRAEAVVSFLEQQPGVTMHDISQPMRAASQAGVQGFQAGVAALAAELKTEGMNWEQALLAMKQGKKVTRESWENLTLHIGEHAPHYTLIQPTVGVPGQPFLCGKPDLAAIDWRIVVE